MFGKKKGTRRATRDALSHAILGVYPHKSLDRRPKVTLCAGNFVKAWVDFFRDDCEQESTGNCCNGASVDQLT